MKRTPAGVQYLRLAVRGQLRRDLDGVVAPQRIAVLHVCVAPGAHAGAAVLRVGTCQRHMLSSLSCSVHRSSIQRLTCTSGRVAVPPL